MSAVKQERPNINLDSLQTRLGYQFQDVGLLKRALTHRSFSADHNERLEFLGDSILGVVVGYHLFSKFPEASEGQLTRLRASLVKGETLAELARELDISSCLILGEGEVRSGGKERESILADALESVIGAIFLDADLSACTSTVLGWLQARLAKLELTKPLKDAKTQLQEYLQSLGKPLPSYTIEELQGQAHNQVITVSCRISDTGQVFLATARSRKQAEKMAAAQALETLMESAQ
ncbi:ribonuclease III [Halioxenophilus sp. WMMB6]|uniref:ribonuclease III n=1 Tax=Halioxenophilus sp. WMMB6 TaxID=3073815 RepID=UPI00295EE739|nr:ribonuclease III [Halioxenophilus sp. WMMB6]